MSENNEASVETNCFRGGFTLKASRLGGAVLRPAVLANSSSSGNSSTTTSLAGGDDSALLSNNPFLREGKDDEEDDDVVVVATGSVPAESTGGKDDDDEVDERPDPLTKLRSNGIERSSMFAAAKNNMPHVQTSGFVFGQNVHERVVAPNAEQVVAAEPDAETAGSSASGSAQEAASSSTAASSSSAQLLFSSVIQNAAQTTETSEAAASSSTCSSSNNNKESAEAKSLTDVAREYEESRAQKRKYEEVETFTGEEDEINIIDVSCKLFAFINSNWEERGRGSLRLNDAKDGRGDSRVVFRTSGNLRLLLNTKVWAAMVVERASQKSLRLTAIDSSGVLKIFLAMGRPADIGQLHKALSERIAKRKLSHPEECTVEETKNGVASEAAASLQPESTTHDDEDEDAAPGPSGAISAEADSYGPSPKKVLVQPDSSADVRVPPVEEGGEDAEAEAKESTDQN
ncbi:ran-binding protein 3 [Drosophila ficusphila]|uniref:ran-binding protein 3 n=1 Tax=Drosophila ficusphila TaxID=30025 RepID=UPI0007E76ED7|nr:ran-binding protein 3 [Drosophila ficusphila]